MSHISTCLKTPGCDAGQIAKEHAAPQFNTYVKEASTFSLFILLPILIFIFAKYGPWGTMKPRNAISTRNLMSASLVVLLVFVLPLVVFLLGYKHQFEACYELECTVPDMLSYLLWPLLVLLCTAPISATLLRKAKKK